MSSAAIEHTFKYPYESFLKKVDSAHQLFLATNKNTINFPYFFKGKLLYPDRTALQLLTIAKVATSRFYFPPAMVAKMILAADPVVTSGAGKLRFESFSQCCGVYSRLDLLQNATDSEFTGRGTTNVDFNLPMRDALSKLTAKTNVNLSVGCDHLELESYGKKVIERKVKLPIRWYKGFVEVQSFASSMKLAFEVKGPVAQRFLANLPSQIPAKSECYLIPSNTGIRMARRPQKGAMLAGGVERLKVLAPLARHLKLFRAYSSESGVSGFELIFQEARLQLIISPIACRGFSGEGQILANLVDGNDESLLEEVRLSLKAKATISSSSLANSLNKSEHEINGALAWLGSRGLIGYDLYENSWFHRELPFQMNEVNKLHPRYKAALKLIENKEYEITKRLNGSITEAFVKGTGVDHRVQLTGQSTKCSCPWHSKYQGQRGICKHILTIKMLNITNSTV